MPFEVSIMASATPRASARGHSTATPEAGGVRGRRCPAAWPHVADAVIKAPFESLWVRFLEACFGFFGDGIVALMSDYRHKRHNVSALIYHIVCPAKSRRVIFDAEVDTVLKEVCLDIAKRYAIAF